MAQPGVSAKQSFVFILSKFKTKLTYLILFPKAHFLFFCSIPRLNPWQIMGDVSLQVDPWQSVSGFHLASLIISGDPLGFYDKLKELNQAIFLQSVI